MSPSLQELCNLIADYGINKARSLQAIFETVSKENANKELGVKESDAVFKVFSFLNWAYANGVWSNLSNTALRRDLMTQSGKSIVLRTAYELSENKEDKFVAMLAVDLDQEFRAFAMGYIDRLKEIGRGGREPDATTALFYALEWIRDRIGLNDGDMDLIVPTFLGKTGDFAKIENIANQINLASAERKKKGFFARLFGS